MKKVSKNFSEMWAWQFNVVFRRSSGRGRKFLGKSIEICKTNNDVKKYQHTF